MKRNCENCRASKYPSIGCELGYSNNTRFRPNKYNKYAREQYPTEECPKPLTYEKYIELRETQQNNIIKK
ncbi:MAG: hypothetical protein WC438_06180 [Candidatus Pacearchaeota archaeon]